MSKIRWFFLRLMIGTVLVVGGSVLPVHADVSPYLTARHEVAVPKAARAICQTYAWACARADARAAFDADDMRQVRRLNARINRQISQIEDYRQYRQAEVWALPTRRGGDCEDIALLKKRELIRAGIPANRLLMAVVLDRQMRGHAVLVVRTHRGDVVLDNLHNRIRTWDRTGYIFLKMQNPDRPARWDAIIAGGPLLGHS